MSIYIDEDAAEKPTQTCPSCKCDMTGKPQGGIGRTWFCMPCYEKHSKVRLERMRSDLAGQDRLRIYWKQIREAMAERDKIRSDTADVIRQRYESAVARVKDEIGRMSFWQRFKVLFNPFGTGW